MEPAALQRDHAGLAEVDGLGVGTPLQVPEVEAVAVLARAHVLEVEAGLEGVGKGPLGGDHGVLSWLVPEVVVELLVSLLALTAAEHAEVLRVEHGETNRAVTLG